MVRMQMLLLTVAHTAEVGHTHSIQDKRPVCTRLLPQMVVAVVFLASCAKCVGQSTAAPHT